jgi:hypothetical protein
MEKTMIETGTSPKFTYFPIAPTSSETIGTSDTIVPGGLFDMLKNATWVISGLPVRLAIGPESGSEMAREKRTWASELGWTKAQVASLKARQASFRDEWSAPGMKDYNDL